MLKHIAFVVLSWIALLVWQQDSIIYHPRKYSKSPTKLELVPGSGYEMTELPFHTSGTNHSAFLMAPINAKASRLYLVFGGNAMLALQWVDVFLGQNKVGSEDIAYLLVDYPGYGKSGGNPSHSSIVQASTAALSTSVSFFNRTLQQPIHRFGAIGHSIGCAAAMGLAVALQGSDTALAHVILSAPFTALPDMAKVLLPILYVVPNWIIGLLTFRHAWDNMKAARDLSQRVTPKVDIIHGEHDSMIPQTQGKQLWELLDKLGFKATFNSVDADHNDILGTKAYIEWLSAALK